MKTPRLKPLALAAAWLVLLGFAPAQAGPDAARAKAYFNAISGGDAATIASFYADDAEFHWVGGPLAGVYKGKDQIKAVWDKFTKAAGELDHEVTQIAESANGKVSTVTARVTFKGQGEVPVKFTMMFKDGKIASEVWQVDKAGAAVAKAATAEPAAPAPDYAPQPQPQAPAAAPVPQRAPGLAAPQAKTANAAEALEGDTPAEAGEPVQAEAEAAAPDASPAAAPAAGAASAKPAAPAPEDADARPAAPADKAAESKTKGKAKTAASVGKPVAEKPIKRKKPFYGYREHEFYGYGGYGYGRGGYGYDYGYGRGGYGYGRGWHGGY
jgi:ketosteroid isomerase-like protein